VTDVMEAGNELEDAIASWWQKRTGRKIRKDNKIRYRDYMVANLDRLIVADGDEGPGILEVKTTGEWNMKKWQDNGWIVPAYWWAQIQHYFAVTGYRWGVFAILIDRRLTSVDVRADDDFIENLIEAERKFWYDHVEKRIPPDPVKSGDVIKLYPKSFEGKTVDADDDIAEAHRELMAVREQIKELSNKEDALKFRIQAAMDDAEIMFYYGQPIATWISARDSESFDKKRFMADHPELYKEYLSLKPGSRRFLLK